MIATYQLTNHENDKGLLAPIIEQFSNEHQAPPEQALADAGYHDTEQIKGLEEQGINCYVAINDNQQALAQQQGLSFTYRRTGSISLLQDTGQKADSSATNAGAP